MPWREPSSRMPREHVFVGDRERRAAAFANRAQNQEITDGFRHPQAIGDGPRVLPHLGPLVAPLEGADDGRACSAWTETIRGR